MMHRPLTTKATRPITQAFTWGLLSLMLCWFGCERTQSPNDQLIGSPIVSSQQDQAVVAKPGVPATRPVRPFVVAEPVAPSSQFGELDLSTLESDLLAAGARQNAADGNYDDAVQLQYWSHAQSEGSEGAYNLACYYSLAGNVEASVYWLLEAAEKEGVDADWTNDDPDLTLVRSDPRWSKLQRYLSQYGEYWKTSGLTEYSLILPSNYQPTEPIPILIGLHGMGGRAKNFVNTGYQGLADEMQIAILGISGPIPLGPSSFVWTEDPQQDEARIRKALEKVSPKLKAAPGQLVLFGFSQGAMVAAEIAARHPEDFSGALIMSPGGNNDPATLSLHPKANHTQQGYVVTCGAEEMLGNIAITRFYAQDLKRLGARVEAIEYPGMSEHQFPPDFADMLPQWVDFILAENRATN
ncbi:hypothetical protein AB1L42_10285 [Thalassoglobus sp. JC818]|uniref:alpha/beta hydrolase n=1 Tax=Thalassoglobus sp. JC818 TaxID=3232136 RepID=UPI0034583F28